MENITLHYLNARDVQTPDMATQIICLSEYRLVAQPMSLLTAETSVG
ncbi:hypothetical protein N9444_03790 [Gammaproteobacteria bacterium]|jgi:hypothetical protein|nr:hypothetical protein [Gammaproteobacteria bacterium]